MTTVHLLWHTNPDTDDELLLGVYASHDEALAAQSRLSDKSGFSKYPDGFEIAEYTVGTDHWTDGFVID